MSGQAATPIAQSPLSPRDALTVARIVKVNHAGEFGAIRIYSAQLLVSSWSGRIASPHWPKCSGMSAITARSSGQRCHRGRRGRVA